MYLLPCVIRPLELGRLYLRKPFLLLLFAIYFSELADRSLEQYPRFYKDFPSLSTFGEAIKEVHTVVAIVSKTHRRDAELYAIVFYG